ncbi:MAG: NAD(P)H-dependent oxidoreductase [Gordonia sp. (in: high G+C Gram-positive bacteria)]|uniref:NAD(P)H-dependent oxidoreductase n=1 Tax=Gordonia sp. (in: high G+C Gram-positive bacteria) TaxID=84139 RepID=UPI0039E6322C
MSIASFVTPTSSTPSEPRTVVVLVGSLRRDSVNRRLARLIARHAPDGVDVDVVDDLDRLPFYNEDLDTDTDRGAAVEELRGRVGAAQAVLLVTPEYNGGLPAVLKNAIDWLSRPYGAGAFTGLPVGVIGAALSRHAGVWARAEARKALGIAGGTVVEEADLGIRTGEFDEDSDELARNLAATVSALLPAVAAAR